MIPETVAITALIGVLSLWVLHSLFLNRRLLQSRTRYHQFFSDSPVAMILIDRNGRILKWNNAAETMFAWSAFEAMEKDIVDLIVPHFDKTHVQNVLKKAIDEGVSFSKNYCLTKHDQELFCSWSNRLLPGTKGEILCMAQDITSSNKNLAELSKRSTALESVGDAIFYTDHKGIIQYANKSFFLLDLGNPADVYNTHIGVYLFKERLAFIAIQSQFDADHTWRGTVTKPTPEGEKVLSVTLTAIYHHKRLISYVANLHDITHLSSHLDVLTHKSQHDPLTGAINRSALHERLERAIRSALRSRLKIGLFFIDMNDFKLVNDRYGHEAGDTLLKEVTRNIRACLRNSDTVCRYGGDEFIVMIEGIKGEEHLLSVHHAIEAAIMEPIRTDEGITLHPKASVGMSLYPDDGYSAEELIKAADTSMYDVKKLKGTVAR
jgi:diguanylate cyclase (GGDEF)-like protein/PAS domain S-box-containing protein